MFASTLKMRLCFLKRTFSICHAPFLLRSSQRAPIVAIRRTPCQGYASRLCGTLVTA